MSPGRKNFLLVALLTIALALAWTKPLDALAERHVEAGLQRALVTFAAARALNAVLSTVQSASLNVGLGVSATLHPGAVLEPLDDLTEQFSTVMLAATVSFAAQRLLLEVLGAWPVSGLLTVAFVSGLIFLVRQRHLPAWLPKVVMVLLCLRFAVPMLAFVGEGTHQLLLARGYESSSVALQAIELPETAIDQDDSVTDKLKRLGAQIETLRTEANRLAEHMVKVSAVFIVQTIVLPFLFLGLLLWLYRVMLAVSPQAPSPAP